VVAHRYDALDYDGNQQLDKSELVSRLAKLESVSDNGSSGGSSLRHHHHSLVLSDPELDALIAAADLGSGRGTKDGGGGLGSGDGMISRGEWWRLVQGHCDLSNNNRDVNHEDIKRNGSNENGGDDLVPCDDEDNIERSSHEVHHNKVVKPVTSSMFRAFALRDLRSDLSSEELDLCFARVCILNDNSSNDGHNHGGDYGIGVDDLDDLGGGSSNSSSSIDVSPAAMKGSLATLGEKGSAAVDRAMEIDFGRFNQFLKLLRAKVKIDN
jgi:hypothetical protein